MSDKEIRLQIKHEQKLRWSWLHALLFLAFWALVGFSSGTATLMGPARWAADLIRKMGGNQGLEDGIVNGIILIFIIISFILSLKLLRLVLKTPRLHIKLGIPILMVVAVTCALFFWLNPQKFSSGMGEIDESLAGARYTFGPYPSAKMLSRLKRDGYTAVISLLHPTVVPFEPKLLADEKAAAARIGIELMHVPMLPWVSDNREAIETIQDLLKTGTGRYYVHCYLGKDRINVIKGLIERIQEGVVSAQDGEGNTRRRLEEIESFERGAIVRVDKEVFVTPFPTDEEYFSFVLSGFINQVVSLMDPNEPPDFPWIEKEENLLANHQLAFEVMPISLTQFDANKMLAYVQKIRRFPHPVVVHGMLSPSARTEGFIQAYRSNLPPLPPRLFKPRMERGPVEVIAPNIAVGPRPTGPEFGSFLHRKGVRRFAYLGPSNSEEARQGRQVTREAGFSWEVFEPYTDPKELFDKLSSGGPWYLYGPLLASLKPELSKRFGPAIPTEVTFDRAEITGLSDPSRMPERRRRTGIMGVVDDFVDFIKRGIPGAELIILGWAPLLLYSALGGALVGHLRMRKNIRTPYTRKIFHFYIFTMAGFLHLRIGFPAVVLFGVLTSLCVLYAVARGEGFPFYEAMARPTDAPKRSFFILVPLLTTALGGGFSNLFFPRFAYIGYFVGGWGDAIAEPVGTRWGTHRYKVPSLMGVPVTRSLEGSLSVLLAGMLVSLAALHVAGFPIEKSLPTALICGMVGSGVEAVSTHGFDNLTIQVAAAATAHLLLG